MVFRQYESSYEFPSELWMETVYHKFHKSEDDWRSLSDPRNLKESEIRERNGHEPKYCYEVASQ
jgi:hypothetical protein